MKTRHFSLIFLLSLLMAIGFVQTISAQDTVSIIGEGGLSVESDKIYAGGGMDDFGAVYSASGDLSITLKDIYVTDNLLVITIALGTAESANNHISSGSVYINGEQRFGGGGAGELTGEPFECTLTLAFYGQIFDAVYGASWDNLRISFDGLVLAAYEGDASGYIGTPEGYSWSFVFHNPEISRYDNDDLAATVDESDMHTFGNSILVEARNFSADGDLSFDIVRESELLNLYGSQNAVWINDFQRGGGGSSVSLDGNGNPETDADTKFIQTDHFLYQDAGEVVHPDSLAVWTQSVSFEITLAGTPRVWSGSISADQMPMKLVQFYNID